MALTKVKLIADSAVHTSQLAAGAVETAKIEDLNVTTAKIANDNVTSAKLAHALDVVTSLGVGGGSTNGVNITQGAIAIKNGGSAQSYIDFYCESSNAHYTRLQSAPHSSYSGNITLTLPASDGDSGQSLITDGSGVMSWSTIGGAYSDWDVKTSGSSYTASNKDQLLINMSSAFTINLPAGSNGNTVIVANAGAGTVTVSANGSEKINSSTDDGTVPQNNSVQLVYAGSTVGWFEI